MYEESAIRGKIKLCDTVYMCVGEETQSVCVLRHKAQKLIMVVSEEALLNMEMIFQQQYHRDSCHSQSVEKKHLY